MTTLAARDPAERVELLIRLTERLTGLLEQETALFEARTPGKAAAFQAEKSQLATIYRREIVQIAKTPALIASAPAPRRAALAQTTRRFNMALAANQQAGEALRAISEGIVRAIAEEVGRLRDSSPAYGPGSAPAAAAPARAVALNRTV